MTILNVNAVTETLNARLKDGEHEFAEMSVVVSGVTTTGATVVDISRYEAGAETTPRAIASWNDPVTSGTVNAFIDGIFEGYDKGYAQGVEDGELEVAKAINEG